MFTGLVEEMGTIQTIKKGAQSAQLTIGAHQVLADLHLGDSIAVNGVCLTVTRHSSRTFTVDVMAETLAKTILGELSQGARVNLERAMALGRRFGGHFVAGHVDGVGEVLSQEWQDIALVLKIRLPMALTPYLIEKGSITINGVSLTIIQVGPDYFTTSLIPLTREETNLGALTVGDRVNLETDILGKYIVKMLNRQDDQPPTSQVDYNFLQKHGFI